MWVCVNVLRQFRIGFIFRRTGQGSTTNEVAGVVLSPQGGPAPGHFLFSSFRLEWNPTVRGGVGGGSRGTSVFPHCRDIEL